MLKIKKISAATLIFVIILSALLAIPASALDYDWVEKSITTKKCTCPSTSVLDLYFDAGGYYNQDRVFTTTIAEHSNGNCSQITATHSATVWYYPNFSSHAYNTISLYDSDTSTTPNTTSAIASSARNATGDQVLFCIESNHTVTTTCTSCGNRTYTAYTCFGDPALK